MNREWAQQNKALANMEHAEKLACLFQLLARTRNAERKAELRKMRNTLLMDPFANGSI